MSRAGFWKRDWFLGLVVAVVLFLLGGTDLLQSFERKPYDLGMHTTDRVPAERIAVIAIDDASVANIGRSPWPRDAHAKVADALEAGGAKVVGNLVFFSEPQVDPGLGYFNRLSAEYRTTAPDPQALEPGAPLLAMGALLQEAEGTLDTDRPLPDHVTRNATGRRGVASVDLSL